MNLRMSGRAGKRAASVGVVVAALAATLAGTAGSAYAVGPGGSEACPANSFCLYYNSPNRWGSFEHWNPLTAYDLGQATFSNWGNGSGYGQTVGGNAAAAVNNTGHTVAVYNGINCSTSGSSNTNPEVEYFEPNTYGRLDGGLYNGAWSFCGD
jgi:hypothetical protein